ncbi:lipid II flippase family protein [Vibrio harveyi]|uniref:lipid II flippase family protein n=1 Tax=Vibrio harveyi TaxID=669 RepID=UPI0018F11755
MSALHSKLAGFRKNNLAISFTFYNSTMAVTRLFFMLMMPFLGFLIDNGLDRNYYSVMVFICLIFSGFLSIIVLVFRERITFFYECLIDNYLRNGRLIYSFFLSFNSPYNDRFERLLRWKNIHKMFFLYSIFIYSIQSLGILITYYFALLNPDYRVTISQLSATINGVATVLLTMKLEPMLSRSMEKSSDFESKFYSVYYGRVLSYILSSPLIFGLIYFLV